MYAISLLKHVVVVLSKSEGPQKWLAPCGTDVHRVARTIDVSILEKLSHWQNNMIMQNEVLIAQNMENLGAISLCLLEQLRPFIVYVDFCQVLMHEGLSCSSKQTDPEPKFTMFGGLHAPSHNVILVCM
jgi:hypothetical protein